MIEFISIEFSLQSQTDNESFTLLIILLFLSSFKSFDNIIAILIYQGSFTLSLYQKSIF